MFSIFLPFMKGDWVTKTRVLLPKKADPKPPNLDSVPKLVDVSLKTGSETHSPGGGGRRVACNQWA